jgi:hypothetical protein
MFAAYRVVAVSHVKPTAGEELQQLAGQIAAQHAATQDQIDQLANLIAQCERESDLLHTVAITLPDNLFRRLEDKHFAASKLLATAFAEVAIGKDWPFSYTDQIGSACARFFKETTDPEIKGLMAVTALSVGASHNRYYVMDVAAGLIASAKDDATGLAVAHALESHLGDFWALGDRVDETKLHPAIRELLTKNEGQ